MIKDLIHNLKVTAASLPEVQDGTNTVVAGAVIDGQGFASLNHMAVIGAAGDTLSGTVKITLKVTHGELSDLSDAVAVTDADVIGGTVDSSGVFATIDANGEAGQIYSIGYGGTKRYSRITATLVGAHSNGTPLALFALQGGPAVAPVI